MNGKGSRLRLLVCEAYPYEVRQQLRSVGASEAGELWRRVLRGIEPGLEVEIACVADLEEALPGEEKLQGYDGVVWTGSSLTVHDRQDQRVQRQIAFARRLRRAGIPQFGSCWGVQLAAVVGGGACAKNHRGREFGVARRIHLLAGALRHPMYRGKPASFLAFTSHADHVVELPQEASWLAANVFSPVQALALDQGAAFWGVQYHPEYDFREIARLCVFRAEELLAQGQFRDRSELEAYVGALEELHRDPSCTEAQRLVGVDATLLSAAERQREIRNWLSWLRSARGMQPLEEGHSEESGW